VFPKLAGAISACAAIAPTWLPHAVGFLR
jgi:hypothetical protein